MTLNEEFYKNITLEDVNSLDLTRDNLLNINHSKLDNEVDNAIVQKYGLHFKAKAVSAKDVKKDFKKLFNV